jgi:hypothetical protein
MRELFNVNNAHVHVNQGWGRACIERRTAAHRGAPAQGPELP